jgi:hypothetical protein
VGVREGLNTHRAVTAAVVGAVIAAALVFGLRGACATAPAGGQAGGPKCFFSIDDGKSWFAEDASKLPPFEHEGKPAYRARVFRCPNGKQFVSHLERYAPADKKRLEDSRSAPGGAGAMVMEETTFMQIGEVKKPGETQWVRLGPQNSEQVLRTLQPKCPDGGSTDVRPVLPD